MTIFDILKKDHRTVIDILEKLESSTTRAEKNRKTMFEKLKQELIPHMFAEENYFYQQILDNSEDPDQRQCVLEGIEEHQAAKTVLSDIDSLSVSDERWQPDIMVLKELLKHHIKEEESNIFDAAKDVLEDFDQVGQDFISMKKEAKVSI